MPQNEEQSNPNTQITRYVEHPGRRRAIRTGQRNLAWGVAFLIAALSVLGIALFVGGPRAVLPPALFMACFTLLWVLARMKTFSQRNGVFFAIAVTALIGSSTSLLEQAWYYLLKNPMTTSLATTPSVSVSPSTPAQAAPVREIPLLTDAPKYERPEASLARVRASKDSTVTVGGKAFAIRKGDIFQLADEKHGEYLINAGEFLARVPLDSMDQLTPEPAKQPETKPSADDGKGAIEKAATAKVTKRSQEDAAHRFPALAQSGSAENKTFVDAFNDLKRRNSDLLEDPEWPMHLAEILARRFGWQEAGVIDPDAPSTVEPSIAPGTKMLAEPDEPIIPPAPAPTAPKAKKATALPPDDLLPRNDPDIPPPPRGPQPE